MVSFGLSGHPGDVVLIIEHLIPEDLQASKQRELFTTSNLFKVLGFFLFPPSHTCIVHEKKEQFSSVCVWCYSQIS